MSGITESHRPDATPADASAESTVRPRAAMLAFPGSLDLSWPEREAFAYRVFEAGGLLLHASAVADGGHGYLFLGASGAGKTTLAGLAPGEVIHDDLVIVRPDGPDHWWVEPAPVPLQQSYPHLCPGGARLARAFGLEQSASVSVSPLSAARAMGLGLSCTPVVALDRRCTAELFARWRRIWQAVPAATLAFRRDASFWPMVADGPA